MYDLSSMTSRLPVDLGHMHVGTQIGHVATQIGNDILQELSREWVSRKKMCSCSSLYVIMLHRATSLQRTRGWVPSVLIIQWFHCALYRRRGTEEDYKFDKVF